MINLSTKEWQIQNIETVLFDKDGTFIDLHYFWGKVTEMRVQEILKRYNLQTKNFDKLCLCLGYDTKTCKMLPDGITALYSRQKIIEIFKNDLATLKVFITEKELEEIFDYVSENFYNNIQKYTKPIDEAIEFIKQLHTCNVKLGIVTSDSKKSTDLTLKYFGLEELFAVVIGRESLPYTKESGEPTKLALETLEANPDTTVMIGDAPMDYISAQNAGIKNTILVATGQIDKQNLLKTCKFTVGSLKNLNIFNH